MMLAPMRGVPGLLVAMALAALATMQLAAGFPWCFAAKNCHVNKQLQAEAVKRGLTIMHYPQPPAKTKWPDEKILKACRYIAYCPLYADGLGSQYNRVLKLVGYALLYNLTYVHIPVDHMEHHIAPDATDAFFNVGYGEKTLADVPDGATVCLSDQCGYSAPMRSVAVDKLMHGSAKDLPSVPGLDLSLLNVAVHIRRGDVMFRERDVKQGRWVGDDYYIDVLKNLTHTLQTAGLQYHVHAFSEGKPELFANISAAFPDITWHLSEDVFLSLKGMMCSDILVKAPSSFSHIVTNYYFDGVSIEPRQGWSPERHKGARNWTATQEMLSQRVRSHDSLRQCKGKAMRHL